MPASFEEVLKQLRNNEITSFELLSNNIGAAGAQALAKALETNTTLTFMDISANSISDTIANSI